MVKGPWADVHTLGSPDSVPERIRSGIDVWIISTYLELRARSLPFEVRIASTFPPQTPVIAHRDDLRFATRHWRSYVAGVRADRPSVHITPWQVVQNPSQEGERCVHIPSWPQPGLVPRSSSRSGVSTFGYFGRVSSLPGFFRDPLFLTELARRGIVFQFDELNWRNYSSIDVCIGLRYESAVGMGTKPYAKLINAWLAGAPALLGPEPAYRHLKRSELDYIEVQSARDVLAALDRLRNDPGLYAAMVANGRKRALEFNRDAVAARWGAFVHDHFLPAAAAWHGTSFIETTSRFARQWRETRRFRHLEKSQLAAIKQAGIGEHFDQ